MFGGTTCPDDHVIRTYRVKVMSRPARHRRARELLVAGGDVWAWAIDRFHSRAREGLPAANSVVEVWPDLRNHGPFGDLQMEAAQDVAKGWSAAFFEVMRRRKSGERARLPLKKRWMVPVTWRSDRFSLTRSCAGQRATVTLRTRRGVPNLTLRLSHDHPYDPDQVRAVRLLEEGGELFLDVTAWVPVVAAVVEPSVTAGVDPGIIHTFAVAAGDQALLVSARACRAEEFLHLADSKARATRQSQHRAPTRTRPGKPRVAGSRRWRKIHAAQTKADARNRRRIRAANNRAARLAAGFLADHRVSQAVIGDPRGIQERDSGRVNNRRVSRWSRAHARKALGYRLEEVGITLTSTEERGTSSRCPSCASPATKSGRTLVCSSPTCRRRHHRDVAGAQNMIGKVHPDHAQPEIAHVEHRRVGSPSRRDHRRHLFDRRRSKIVGVVLPVSGPPGSPPGGQESLVAA